MQTIRYSLVALSLLAGCSGKDQGAEPAATELASTGASGVAEAQGATVSPSFDCAKASSDAEKLVCSDPLLAALDSEVTRLYALAKNASQAPAAAQAELQTLQRGWIKGRDDCWKADDKRQCVLGSYAMRIMDLRQGSAAARSRDTEGVSRGPVVYLCDGLDAPIGAVFVNTKPAVAYLKWLDQGVALSASGADQSYSGQSYDGTYTLVVTPSGAQLTRPGQPSSQCRQDEIG